MPGVLCPEAKRAPQKPTPTTPSTTTSTTPSTTTSTTTSQRPTKKHNYDRFYKDDQYNRCYR
ncbi:hypothetical protein DPMN_091215 [Dreissena polymorpha]|nr:hypothetical protein DPMN_091215 [Dreissena polymorpha]